MGYFLHRLLVCLEHCTGLSLLPRDRILSAWSTDGLRWQREVGIRLAPAQTPKGDMVYWPHLTKYGDAWRMYFFCSRRERCGWRGAILSARSADGVVWTVEAGERLSPGGERDRYFCEAPWVVETAAGLRLYYAGAYEQGRSVILSAFSENGIDWRKEEGIRLAPPAEVQAVTAPCVMAADGNLRMYYTSLCGSKAWIASAISGDGLCWRTEQDIIRGVGHITPRRNARNPAVFTCAGLLRMIFAVDDGSPLDSRLHSACSADGISWRSEGEILDASGPWEGDGVNFPHVATFGEGWRLFYAGFWGPHILRFLTHRKWRRLKVGA